MNQLACSLRLCQVWNDQESGLRKISDVHITIEVLGRPEALATANLPGNLTGWSANALKAPTYRLARQYPLRPVERFGALVAHHFITTMDEVSSARVEITEQDWNRMYVNLQYHPHSFHGAFVDRPSAQIVVSKGQKIKVVSVTQYTRVLRSLGTSFYVPVIGSCDTQLVEADGHLLDAQIECEFRWKVFSTIDEIISGYMAFNRAQFQVTEILREIFSNDDGPLPDIVLRRMGEKIVEKVPHAHEVALRMQDKVYLTKPFQPDEEAENVNRDIEIYVPGTHDRGVNLIVVKGDS